MLATYDRMLEVATGVVLGANTLDAGELTMHGAGASTPVRAFYRYPPAPESVHEPRSDGVHLVMVGGALFGDSKNPFFVTAADLLR